jgi:hypothetical protein
MAEIWIREGVVTSTPRRYEKTARTRTIRGLALAGLIVALPGFAEGQDSLALKRVTLSSGGVGYFEYETTISGDTEVSLPVRLDQVDDVLKSLVIRDTNGVAATVRLAGREPLSQIFRNLPIDQRALASPGKLLHALKGSEIKVSGGRSIRGRIVAVVAEKTKLGDGLGETTRHRVSLLTTTGLQHFILEDSQTVQFTDPKLVGAVQKGLAAIEENRAQDKRVLHIRSSGTGKRSLSAGYVVRVPVWKTTYRLTLPALDNGSSPKVRLEGWAILENMSAEDWNGVELTLVSGNPVTFRQSLYSAYYVNRPEVPVAVIGRLLPRADKGSVQAITMGNEKARDSRRGRRSLQKSSVAEISRSMEAAADMMKEAPQAPSSTARPARLGAIAQDAATQIVFRLPRPVSVKTGHSLSVRFLNREIAAERVSLFQPDTHARHPLASVRLKNDAKTGLPPGALTFYETGANGGLTYMGDAQLNTLPVGETRILSYALDNKTTIDRETSSRQSILKGKISKGLLEVTRLSRMVTSYRIKLSAPEGRKLIIEQRRQAGWKITKPEADTVSLTPRHYRIPHQLEAASSGTLEVVVERPHSRSYRLTSLSLADALVYAGTQGFDPPMRKAFETLATLKRDIDEKEKTLNRLEAERKRWANDQARIRSNLSKVPRNSDIHRRYLKRLSDHEKKIENTMGRLDGARLALDKAKTALSDFIQKLEL